MKTFTGFLVAYIVTLINVRDLGTLDYPLPDDNIAQRIILHCAPAFRFQTGKGAQAETNNKFKGMVLIPAGDFEMGSGEFEDAFPIHKVKLHGFYMDETEVTNAEFEEFVKATGYITVAETKPVKEDFPGVPEENLISGSAVFIPPCERIALNDPLQWWRYTGGANWKHPLGPGSNIEGKGNEPVVQICYIDAVAYARWAGKRLPTEAEWEYAARAGQVHESYYWGDSLLTGQNWMANIFQGRFPDSNSHLDGYVGVAPVKSFKPNSYGLYDMEGNVWEWCSDLYNYDYYRERAGINPQGPNKSYDPDEPQVIKHVQRGGSFLCSDQYCTRYKAGSRGKGETNSASNNLGFRCVMDL